MRLSILAALVIAPVCGAQNAQQGRASEPPAPAPEGFGGPFTARPYGSGAIKVGPERGTVMVAGGGIFGPDFWKTFVDAAGGPDALIINVLNAGAGDAAPMLRDAGARNIQTIDVKDRRIADGDSLAAIIRKAGGVWFVGGRQFHLVQDYGGTQAEREFMGVLERGGVIAGSSAGASILGDFMVRGAPSNNNNIMDYPGYERAFGYLRNVGIDQHVVARSRLPDLADSVIPRHRDLLGISEDEGTAWFIRGDTARIMGRNKAFVTNGRDATDPGAPFLTLYPGDRYNLATRHVISRVADRSPVKLDVINKMFAAYADPAKGGATVLLAQDGNVFVDQAFGIPMQPRFMPRTTLPQFELGDISKTFTELCAQLPADTARRGGGAPAATGEEAPAGGRRGRGGPPPSPMQRCVTRISTPIGAHQTSPLDSTRIQSSVDELYRFALGLEVPATWRGADYSKGWMVDTYKGSPRYAAYATPNGKRAAFLRVPDRHTTVIVLTNDSNADAKGMAETILDRALGGK